MSWKKYKKQLARSVKKQECAHDGKSVRSQTLTGRRRINGNGKAANRKIRGLERLFVGHTPQKDGVQRLGNIFYIDTAAAKDNFLTLANVQAKRSDIVDTQPDKGTLHIIDVA